MPVAFSVVQTQIEMRRDKHRFARQDFFVRHFLALRWSTCGVASGNVRLIFVVRFCVGSTA